MKHAVRSSLLLAAALWLAVTASGGAAHACLNANHRHRVLLGVTSAGPVVLELDLHRDPAQQGNNVELVTWSGDARIHVPASKDPIQRLPAFTFSSRVHYGSRPSHAKLLAEFRDAFDAAVASAQSNAARIDGFVPAPTPTLELCNSRRRCGLRIELAPNGQPLLVAEASPQAVKAPVDLPPRFLREATDLYGTLEDFFTGLEPRRVLSYPTAAGTVLVVDVGVRAGDPEAGDAGAVDEPADRVWPGCRAKRTSPYPPAAATLEHGAQVEVIIPLGAASRRAPGTVVRPCGNRRTATPTQSPR